MQDNNGGTVPVKTPEDPKVVPVPQPSPVRPPVGAARMRRRHRGLALSFVLLVLAPFLAVVVYLYAIAEDQYGSITGFTVRSEESEGASELLGGLVQLTGSSTTSDGNILYEFIRSQALVRRIEEAVGLTDHYVAHWETDPVFSLWPDASIEDMEWFWRRVVRISYDQGSGLMEVRVLAFTPEKAHQISTQILHESQQMINALNTQAREDAMRYARDDLEDALLRVKVAREALSKFRSRTQIVDPEADISGRLVVMTNLQQQLAEALISHDLLLETANQGDPRLAQARRRIDVIRERIEQERVAFATGDTESGAVGEDYPNLLAEYEGLIVDREFAEQTYRAALTAVDLARAKAQRQSRYLATFIHPTLPESSEYPQRLVISGLAGLFLLLSWAIMALVYYSIRDRK